MNGSAAFMPAVKFVSRFKKSRDAVNASPGLAGMSAGERMPVAARIAMASRASGLILPVLIKGT
jgi:hypothetical protein